MINALRIFDNKNNLIKEITFKKGLNVILADITETEDIKNDKKSRNGAGKTTLIEIIDFCLAGNQKTLDVKALENWLYAISITLQNKNYTVYRAVHNSNRIYFSDGDYSFWKIKPRKIKQKKGFETDLKYVLKEDEWKSVLGNLIFDIDDENSIPYAPTYRSIISYFIRYKEAAFIDPFKTFSNQPSWQIQVYNAFLLNLNWEYAATLQKLKDTKDSIQALKKATKKGYLENFFGTIGELEAEKVALENRVKQFDEQLANFHVHPQYEQIQKEANSLTKRIHKISDRITIQKSLLEKYQYDMIDEKDTDINVIERVYNEAGLIFPKDLTKSLEEIIQFHTIVIKNRKEYLSDEIKRLEANIKANENDIARLSSRRAENMHILKTHNAMDEYNQLQSRNTALKSKLNAINEHITNIKKIENGLNENKKQMLDLLQNAQQDLEERKVQRTLAMQNFAEIAEHLYADILQNEKIGLSIDFNENGYKFNAFIGKDNSSGRTSMKVFDYDMTIMKINNQLNNNLPGFLIHDSDIYDPVDERQIARALYYADNLTSQMNTQYICAINSDRIAEEYFEETFKVKFYKECVRLKLEDTNDGGLFGFKF